MRLTGKRVATYARYSSDLQRDASIEDQQHLAKKFIEKNGGALANATHLVDRAESGASLEREGIQALLDLVRAREVDVIITEDTSRISRDKADFAFFCRELPYYDVELIGLSNGFDSSLPHSSMQAMLEGWKNEEYLRDLGQKSRRGLEGRARAGLSTGGLPYGYRSAPVTDTGGDTIGHRIVVCDEDAVVLRKIFETYLDGTSLAGIASSLNKDGTPPPRATTKHRRKGWVASTIRFMLHNSAYVGRRSFNKREWRKLPGTNKRRSRPRNSADIITNEQSELRIIDEATWNAVQARLAAVHARYTKTDAGKPKGRGIAGGSTSYLLSGLMVCGTCGAPMVICGGSTTKYYWCGDYRKRGTCSNQTSLREDIARTRILGALHDRFSSPAALAYLRQRVAEHLGNIGRGVNADLEERRQRLARTEAGLTRLIQFVADGNDSEAIRLAIKDREAQARTEKAIIKGIVDTATTPVRLPAPEELVKRARELDAVLTGDPTRGREALRRLFADGHIRVTPQAGGTYLAESTLLPMMLFAPDAQSTAPPTTSGRGRSFTAVSCAGRI
jgi:site-specific DNA recombinase